MPLLVAEAARRIDWKSYTKKVLLITYYVCILSMVNVLWLYWLYTLYSACLRIYAKYHNLGVVSTHITSIQNLNDSAILDDNRAGSNKTTKYVEVCCTKLLNHLHGVLHTIILLYRSDLLPVRHWVWDSLRIKLKKMAATMLLSGHIIDYNDLKLINVNECMLCKR